MTHGICEHCGLCRCCDECECEEWTHTPSGGKFWIVPNRMHCYPLTERDQRVHDAAERAAYDMEIMLLYGGSPLAVVSGRPFVNAMAITASSWAAGLWQDSVGRKVDAWDAVMATQRNIHGPLTVTGFELHDRVVYVSGHAMDILHIGAGDCITAVRS